MENTKTAMFIRGGHTSETVTQALKDLVRTQRHTCGFRLLSTVCSPQYALKKPDAVMFKRYVFHSLQSHSSDETIYFLVCDGPLFLSLQEEHGKAI